MIHSELLAYVRERTHEGVAREDIKNALRTSGWQEADIEAALSALSNPPVPLPPPAGPQVLLGAGELLAQAWELYKKRWQTLLGIMLFSTLSLGAFILYFMYALPVVDAFGFVGLLFTFLFVAAYLVVQTAAQMALVYAIQDEISVGEAYEKSWSKVHSFWWVGILVAFATMGGFILLVIPGIVLSVWLCLAIFIFLIEDVKGVNALVKSREYVRGYGFPVFLRLLCYGLLILALYLIVLILLLLLRVPLEQSQSIVEVAAAFFIAPLSMAYMFFLYTNLRGLKRDVPFVPTSGARRAFIAIAVIGGLVAPIGILSGVVVARLGDERAKARDARRVYELSMVELVLQIHKDTNGAYPSSLQGISPDLLPEVPVDPQTNIPYKYELLGPDNYQVCAQLEKQEDLYCLPSGI